ncbi:hypothetical protein [Streptosporangium sp. NPDC050280]|uniref:hypothetical protein n=1 Tax=unclassified Streptosporangium TaxID=2632669 RepID=UPI003437E81A
MSKDFRIEHEGALSAMPQDVWDAVTRDSDAWSMPFDMTDTTALVWEPPRRSVLRMEIGDWFNQIEFDIEQTQTGSYIRYVHSGIFTDDWENQYDGARRHTELYMHTLVQYLTHFPGRRFRHFEVLAPESSITTDALDKVRAAWGIHPSTPAGSKLTLPVPGADAKQGVLDFHNDTFIGVRTEDTLLRVFGRNHFGAPVAIGAYEYGDQARPEQEASDAWAGWLRHLYGTVAAR